MSIGDTIKRVRKEKKIKQTELAAKLGVSASMIAQYENDHRTPKIETVEKIAKALQVDILYLLSDSFMTYKDAYYTQTEEGKKSRLEDCAYYAIIKILEAIYGRSEMTNVQFIKDNTLYGERFFLSLGTDQDKLAIDEPDFRNIIEIVKNLLCDIVKLTAIKESALLTQWQEEEPDKELITSETEHVELIVSDTFKY